jgi:hypothetical protein
MNKQLIKLLKDFGYKVVADGDAAIVIHDNGYSTSATRYRSLLSAAERLVPIIHNDNYYNRLTAIRDAA